MTTLLQMQQLIGAIKMKSTQFSPATISSNAPFEVRAKYKTVEQFSRDNPAFTIPALRNLIFKAEVRHTSKGVIKGNGLLEAGAIVRIGRKVLINESSFYLWIEHQNLGDSK